MRSETRMLSRALLLSLFTAAAWATGGALTYPDAHRGDVVDDYHGVKVADPYRELEDIDSPETRAWVQAENNLARHYLGALPGRDAIVRRLRKIWNFELWTAPERHGRYWFYTHNDGLQNQAAIFVTADPAEPGHILLDPNALSNDGTVALRDSSVSDDGRLFAYALSDGGADWVIWHVRNVETGVDLPDQVHWSMGDGTSWLEDGSGFYYTAYNAPKAGDAFKAPNQYERLYFHKLGTAQSQDKLIYARTDDPQWLLNDWVTEDGRYLVIQANRGAEVRNTLLVQDLAAKGGNAPIRAIIPWPTAVCNYIGNIGTTLYVTTDDGAPRYKVVAIDLTQPEPANWQTVVPESADTLTSATLVGGQLVAQYLRDAHSAVRRFTPEGKALGEVQLAGLGEATGFQGHSNDHATYYTYSDFVSPPGVYRLDLATGKTSLWKRPEPQGFDSDNYQTKQVFYSSKDGTRVPLYIVSRKGTRLDGRNPTILYGYGGFNISKEPAFEPAIADWLEMGGVYAMANIRGGGEYGRAWHEAGMKLNKQNVFDDFIAAAEYLIAQRWTGARHLAIRGGSNGGLLIGATEVQRPDLFAAAVLKVGVLDMLRFREFTVGKAWEAEYGSVDDPDELQALLAYSPVHNLKPGVSYPATLVITGDHDDRVFPAHSLKFTAALQNADPKGRPILLDVEQRQGHGAGKPTATLIEETASVYAFILNATK
ncbi:prolyl oligopeptidase family serine peptidase [Caballeronia mineralivorans]|uniref:prolyl oligopeptidase family serine peptidase n=1 Tax=Caballeronia mineralivorans TaxID=2010198 RepID=UPI003211F496|nr:Prolyl endopeptidase [Caballeronia mineralivorans]